MSATGASSPAGSAGRVDLILDSDGLILNTYRFGENARLAAAVSEGEAISQYLHPDDHEFFALIRQLVMRPQSIQSHRTIVLRWARTNGHYTDVYATLSAESGQTLRVSLRRDTVEWARRTASQLRKLVEGSLQGVVVRTATKILFMNDSFAHLLGYANAHDLGSRLVELGANGAVHPDDVPKMAERLRRRTSGEEVVSHYELRMMHRDGSVRWVDMLATLIEWDGQPASLSWMTDITERKAMEAEILKSRAAAESASRTKTEFLAHMSHELRTPLNAIIGFAEIIAKQLFGPVGLPRYVDYANDIRKSGEHLLDLINDVLDMSKLEAGKLELRESDVSLRAIVEQCCSLVRGHAEAGQVTLVVDMPENLPALRADQRAMKQVLLNLLSNAIKFTPEGGRVTTRLLCLADNSLSILVSDTGIGMSEDGIKIALSPFGQIDSKIAQQNKGTGLGLPISKSLIELHGGTLRIDSEPNKGTTMIATFPSERVKLGAA